MLNLEFFMAARSRIVYKGQLTLAGSIIGKADDDDLVVALEETFDRLYGKKIMSCLDAIEYKIAELADAGGTIPISNPEGYGAAQWIAQMGLANLPNPMPRGFVLYFAQAMHAEGQYSTISSALKDILTTKTFV